MMSNPVIIPNDLKGVALVLAPILGLSTEQFLIDISTALNQNRLSTWDNLGIPIKTDIRTVEYREQMNIDQKSYLSQDEKDFIFRQEAMHQLQSLVERANYE